MDPAAVRRAHEAIEPLHAFAYFTPEFHDHLVGVGLKGGLMPYFAARAAPMGAVGAGVVAATFYNFSPSFIARAIPKAWTLASPEAIVQATAAAVDAALTRLLGADLLASVDVARLAELTREATGGCDVSGRPLYAGLAGLTWPPQPHMAAWHAISMLREHRGDGHIAALNASGLTGLEALVTHVATGKGFIPSFAKFSRGYSDEEWDGAIARLQARAILDPEGSLTPAGQELRARLEAATDAMATAPWQHLGSAKTEEVIRLGTALTAALRSAGGLPTTGVTEG
jgi:hypothetical protein